MIFPSSLELVTFYLPSLDSYHEIRLSGGRFDFVVEPFYKRNTLSSKTIFKLRGLRLSANLNFEQSTQHSAIRAMLNAIKSQVDTGIDDIRLFLKDQASIVGDDDYFQLIPEDLISSLSYSNTIGRHGYDLSFVTKIISPEITDIDVIYVIVENGDFVINSALQNIIVEVLRG